MASKHPPVAIVRSKKQVGLSLGTLTTLDAFECVSDSDSEVDTVISESPSLARGISEGPEPTETDKEAALKEIEGEDDEISNVLAELGFTEDTSGEPLLTAGHTGWPSDRGSTAGQPPRYKNLFWREYVAARQPKGLTKERLEQHPSTKAPAFPFGKLFSPSCAGEWLAGFKSFARSVPVRDMTTRLLGEDIGSDVADFVGDDAMGDISDQSGTILDPAEKPDGTRVIASKFVRVPACVRSGRRGFVIDDEVSISTPGQRTPRGSSAGSEAGNEDGVSDGEEIDFRWPLHSGVTKVRQSRAFDGTA